MSDDTITPTQLARLREILEEGERRADEAEGLIPAGHFGFFGALDLLGPTESRDALGAEVAGLMEAGLLEPIAPIETVSGVQVWSRESIDILRARIERAREVRDEGIRRRSEDAPPVAPAPANGLPPWRPQRSLPSVQPTIVYFIQATAGGLIKIGTTGNVKGRLRVLQGGSPERLRVLATMLGGREQEAALHVRFAAHRAHGEWFVPVPELLAFIAEQEQAL